MAELFEVRQERDGELSTPRVTAELIRRLPVVLDVDGGLLGFEEELADAADAEGIVRRLGLPGDLHAVLVDDLAILLGKPCRLLMSQPSSFISGSMKSTRMRCSL